MIMRIATSTINDLGYRAIAKGQSDVYRIQAQFASGKRINSAADDPTGAVRAAQLQASDSVNAQYSRNQKSATSSVSYLESLTGNIGDLYGTVKESLIQASNGALSTADRKQIAGVLQARLDELANLANSQDESGRYLFSGYNENTAPISISASGTTYQGDNGVKAMQVSPSVAMPINVSGQALFMDVKGGNGVIQTSLSTSNSGNALISGGNMVNATAYDGSTFSISILAGGSGPQVQVTNTTTGNVVISGLAFKSGAAIGIPLAAGGASVMEVQLAGSPAVGDSFTIQPSGSGNPFDALRSAIDAITANANGTLSNAALNDAIRNAQANIDQSTERALQVRNTLGNSLQELDRQASINDRMNIDIQSRLGDVVDLDTAKAATDLTKAQMSLSASQQVYSKLAKQTLFDYL
jgi:flagellar hook-associated protein 3 FlgL